MSCLVSLLLYGFVYYCLVAKEDEPETREDPNKQLQNKEEAEKDPEAKQQRDAAEAALLQKLSDFKVCDISRHFLLVFLLFLPFDVDGELYCLYVCFCLRFDDIVKVMVMYFIYLFLSFLSFFFVCVFW